MRHLLSRFLFWNVRCPSGMVVFKHIDPTGEWKSKAKASDSDAQYLLQNYPSLVKDITKDHRQSA